MFVQSIELWIQNVCCVVRCPLSFLLKFAPCIHIHIHLRSQFNLRQMVNKTEILLSHGRYSFDEIYERYLMFDCNHSIRVSFFFLFIYWMDGWMVVVFKMA